MKKIVCGMMATLFAFSFSSCAFLENFQTDTQAQLDELNAKIEQQAQEINGLKADKDALLKEVNELAASNDDQEEKINELLEKIESGDLQTYEDIVDWVYYAFNAPFGVFVDLQTAYDYGVLTMDDLMSIAYYQNSSDFDSEYNQGVIPEDYTPQPKNPETIDEDLQRKMKETMQYEEDVYILLTYFGCYNGVYVLRTDMTFLPIYDYAGGIYFEDGGGTRAYIPEELYPEVVAKIREERGY